MSVPVGKKREALTPSGQAGSGEVASERKGFQPDSEGSVQQPLPMGPSFTVARCDLIKEMVREARRTGIVMLCAPKGFGKTALLLQYADEVRGDPNRGVAHIIDASGALVDELIMQLRAAEASSSLGVRPVLEIDNTPVYEGLEAERLVEHLRSLRERGFEVVLACTPAARELLAKLGDSTRMYGRRLLVRPREYAEWARVFSISSKLDVYGLTQGIPSLVATLQSAVEPADDGMRLLEASVFSLYWSALLELEQVDGGLCRLAETLLLVGDGAVSDFEYAGMPIGRKELQQLMHDYPVFGYNATTGSFSCLGTNGGARGQIRSYIANSAPQLVRRAVRIQVRAGRMDRAVDLLEAYLTVDDALNVLAHAPVQLALAGQASFLNRVIGQLEERLDVREVDPNIELAVYASALISGEFRMARTMASALALRLDEAALRVAPGDWHAACALGAVWGSCRGVKLPSLPSKAPTALQDADALKLHVRCMGDLIERGEWSGEIERFNEHARWREGAGANKIDVPRLLLQCDVMLAEALTGAFDCIDERDHSLSGLERVLRERKLGPLLGYVRLVCTMRRLLAGSAIVDEKAIVDMNTLAVRTSDLPLQLFCTILEGWQDMVANQAGSAQFRGQQAMKLAADRYPYLEREAYFLERIAHLRSSSRFAISEEAAVLDLSDGEVGTEQAWVTALYLSAAGLEAELAAWYSLQKDQLLMPSFRLFARLAMSVLGERADPIRRLLPQQLLACYLMDDEDRPAAKPLFQIAFHEREEDIGQVTLRLFGGFSIERNGHVLTSSVWKRKKAGLLAARLALAQGGLVSRRVIMDEFWPKVEFTRARESLYSTVSVLRRAFGQTGKEGPQYLILQGDSLGINTEYVTSDVRSFEAISRKILLSHSRSSASKIVELCLRAEELYAGPLFVPDQGPQAYFMRMRKIMQSKYIDCMVRGVDAAIGEDDLSSALWMAEAGLEQDSMREDMLRAAMRAYDALGRQRDIMELYSSHAAYLKRYAKGKPEPATERLYHEIASRGRTRGTL